MCIQELFRKLFPTTQIEYLISGLVDRYGMKVVQDPTEILPDYLWQIIWVRLACDSSFEDTFVYADGTLNHILAMSRTKSVLIEKVDGRENPELYDKIMEEDSQKRLNIVRYIDYVENTLDWESGHDIEVPITIIKEGGFDNIPIQYYKVSEL